MNHYETLGADRADTAATIKAKFRQAASAAHPDREGGSVERMQAVNAAWAVLGDPARRADYDRGGSGAETESPDAEAKRVLASLFAEVLRKAPDGVNPVKHLRDELASNKEGAERALREAQRQADRMRRRAEQIKSKGADNILREVAESLAAGAEREKDAALQKLALVRRVRALLGDYSYEMSDDELRARVDPRGSFDEASFMDDLREAMKSGGFGDAYRGRGKSWFTGDFKTFTEAPPCANFAGEKPDQDPPPADDKKPKPKPFYRTEGGPGKGRY